MSWHPEQFEQRIAAAPARYATAYQALNLPDPHLRRYLAVHEAGHAVIGVLGGGRIASMKIAADLGYGPASHDSPIPEHGAATIDWRSTTVKIEALLRMTTAGEVAQQRWLRGQGLWTPDRAWVVEILAVHDRSAAQEAVHSLGGELAFAEPYPPDATRWQSFRAQTADLLTQHWPAVLELAEALDKQTSLNGDTAHSMISNAATCRCGDPRGLGQPKPALQNSPTYRATTLCACATRHPSHPGHDPPAAASSPW
jgi:hypothetical protein